jgi:hypothetical protein
MLFRVLGLSVMRERHASKAARPKKRVDRECQSRVDEPGS